MTNKQNDKSCQKRFLEHEDTFCLRCKLLMGGVIGLKDAFRLGVLQVE